MAAFWKTSHYRAWFAADTASALGFVLRDLALSMVAYDISGSVALAGWLVTLVTLAGKVSQIFGGTFVDRHDRRTLILVNAAVGVVIWGTAGALLMGGVLTFPILTALAVLAAAVGGFLGEATDAMLRSIIDIADYPQARSINEGRDATVSIIGGPLGGMLYAITAWLPFLASVLLYAVSGVTALHLPHDWHRAKSETGATDGGDAPSVSGASFLEDFLEGWAWSFHRRRMPALLVMAALVNFAMNCVSQGALLYLIADGTPRFLVGLLDTGLCVMTLVGAVIAGRWSARVPVGAAMVAAMVFYAVCMVPMVVSQTYPVVLVCLSLFGLPLPLVNAGAMGFVFAKTPPELQGRISSTVAVPAMVLAVFSGAIAGESVARIGLGGLAALALVVVVALVLPLALSKPVRTIPAADRWDETDL